MSKHGKAARHEMIVCNIERVGRCQSQSIWRKEVRGGYGSHMNCVQWSLGIYCELLDDRAFTCVVNCIKIRGIPVMRRPYCDSQWMKVMVRGIIHEGHRVRSIASYFGSQM